MERASDECIGVVSMPHPAGVQPGEPQRSIEPSGHRPAARNPPSESARRRSRRRPGSSPAACGGSGSRARAGRHRYTNREGDGAARREAIEAKANGIGRRATPSPSRAAWAMASGSLRISRGRHSTGRSATRRERKAQGRTRPVGEERRMMPSKRRQVVGRARHRPAGHVARRRHGDDVHRRQLARDHAGGQREAAADRGIEALADDVDPAVVEVPVGQHRADSGPGSRRAAAPGSGGRRPGPCSPSACRSARRRSGARRQTAACSEASGPSTWLQEPLAAFGQRQPTRAAMEQAHAEIGLEPRHVLADAGRRQARGRAPRRRSCRAPPSGRTTPDAATVPSPILNRGLKLIACFRRLVGARRCAHTTAASCDPRAPTRQKGLHARARSRPLRIAAGARPARSLLGTGLRVPRTSSSARSPPTAPPSTSVPAARARRSCCCTATARPATCGCRWPRIWRATTR